MYRRSKEIEERLHDLIELVRKGGHSTSTLATALGVSRPTVSRCLTALRERGYAIRAVRGRGGWAYELSAEPETAKRKMGAR